MNNDFFKLKDHGTTVRREVLAGITTFMTMAYVLAVQPSAICGFGPDPYITDINGVVISKSALLVMCALVSGIITLFMGLYANLPLALSTAMGSNFILGGLVNSGTVSFGWAMALLLCSGILFILVTVLGVRKMVVDLLPKNLKIAIPTAVGFFIAYLGFKNTGLAAFSDSGLALGDFTQPAVLLALITMAVMGVLTAYKVRHYLIEKEEKPKGHPRDYAEIAAEGIIHASTEYNSISFYVDDDTLSGFHYELIEAFARDHGLQAAISPEMSFNKRLEGLADGQYDVIAYGILATSELKDSLLLTTPIVLNKQVLVQRKLENISDSSLFIKSQLDLAGKTLHVVKGSPSILRIRNLGNECRYAP